MLKLGVFKRGLKLFKRLILGAPAVAQRGKRLVLLGYLFGKRGVAGSITLFVAARLCHRFKRLAGPVAQRLNVLASLHIVLLKPLA